MSELPIVNVELMKRVLAHIKADPENWHQGQWIDSRATNECKTAGCFAGWTVLLEGYRPVYGKYSAWDNNALDMVEKAEDVADYVIPPGGGEEAHIGAVARQLLGLTRAEGNALFDMSADTIDKLETIMVDIVAGRYRQHGPEEDIFDV